MIDRIFYAACDPHGDPIAGCRLSDLYDCSAVRAAERVLESAKDEDQRADAMLELQRVIFAQGFRMGMKLAQEVSL